MLLILNSPYKIIADSGSNVTTLADTDFASVPITIMAGGKEYIDDAALDILAMTDELIYFRSH